MSSATALQDRHSSGQNRCSHGIQRTLGGSNHGHDGDAEHVSRQPFGREDFRGRSQALALSMMRSTPPWVVGWDGITMWNVLSKNRLYGDISIC